MVGKMLEVKYYRDYRHNYMILQCGNEALSRSYQYKILTSGKIGEILKCTVRHVNGTTYYYYDISSRTTLESLYRGKKMSAKQVKDVLWQLHGICDRLSGYFMEEARLVLEPEYIYYDMTNQKYIGLYYPDYQTEDTGMYRSLMDFLLEHIDTQDQQLTENMYRIYEMAEEPCFSLEDALQILEEQEPSESGLVEINTMVYNKKEETGDREHFPQHNEVKLQGEKPYDGKICDAKSNDEKINTREFYDGKEQDRKTDARKLYDEELLDDKMRGVKTADEKLPRRSLYYPVCAMASLAGMAGVYVVYRIYELTQEEELALYGAMAVMGVCFMICVAGSLRKRKKRYTGNMVSGKKEPVEDEEAVSLENVLNKDMNLEMADLMSVSCRAAEQKDRAFGAKSLDMAQEDVKYGNTVFFDADKIGECKLYAVDRRNKRHIELKQFPCTVGKMAGCVDYVLPDDSVSRIHARFDREGEKILLTDMNSTNGTYKNGLRMQPQETVEIEPGDEVRFGNLNYCYR